MSTTPSPVRDDLVGHWAIRKHRLLRDYLVEYTKIMRAQRWCLGFEYIDAFAGTGRPRLRDQEQYISGSPRVALDLPHPFTRYTFIEMSRWRVERLEQLRAEFPERPIEIVQGDCNEAITSLVTSQVRREYQRRGFVFLDPFGANLAYDTIERIAATGALEIFLHFPTMALNRAALRRRGDAMTPDEVAKMDRVWGSHGWHGLLYGCQPTLFSEPVELKLRRTDAEYLGRLFVEHRLRPLFPYVTDPIVMKNSVGGDLYCLIFAGHNKTGARIADHIFRKDERRAPVLAAATLFPELLC